MIPTTLTASRRMSADIERYEGLVHSTSRMLVEVGVEMDFDDMRQFLRLKVWKALEKYDSARSGLARDRFVFGCVVNAKKDLLKRPRRFIRSIDAMREADAKAADWFDARYLSDEVEHPDDEPFPCLTATERQVAEMQCNGFTLPEIDLALGLGLGQAKTAMRSVREKLDHLRPSAAERRSAPLRPLPGAAPRTARTRPALAA